MKFAFMSNLSQWIKNKKNFLMFEQLVNKFSFLFRVTHKKLTWNNILGIPFIVIAFGLDLIIEYLTKMSYVSNTAPCMFNGPYVCVYKRGKEKCGERDNFGDSKDLIKCVYDAIKRSPYFFIRFYETKQQQKITITKQRMTFFFRRKSTQKTHTMYLIKMK